MGFCSFVKYSKSHPERLSFFQSTSFYLNYNSLINYEAFRFRTGNWFYPNPHPSNSNNNYLSIDAGHYGLYVTVYNRDAERRKRNQTQYLCDTLHSFLVSHSPNQLSLWEGEEWSVNNATQFLISKINLDVHNNIVQIKDYSRKFLSCLAIVKPKHVGLCGNYQQRRNFVTTSAARKDNHLHEPINHQISEDSPADTLETSNSQVSTYPTSAGDIALDYKAEEPAVVKEHSFESGFLETQVRNIVDIYNAEPDQMNLIYPLYQSLKRNDIELPNIELYNIVLKSVSSRSLDSEQSLEAIESKLTTLLTVYQDILTSKHKPNNETFNIVMSNLLRGSISVTELSHSSSNANSYFTTTSKAKEFGQIAIELFDSIQKKDQLKTRTLIPKIVQFLIYYPNLIKKSIMLQIYPFITSGHYDCEKYHHNLMELAKYLPQSQLFEGKPAAAYDFIVSIYENYKAASQSSSVDEFVMYSKLIESLIFNNEFALASKFLDDILVDYKNSINNYTKPSKEQISRVISSYISAIFKSNPADLSKAYSLMMKFNSISYLPELSNKLYNDMIIKYVEEYQSLEAQKASIGHHSSECMIKVEQIGYKQNEIYQKLWSLYDYMAIRKDYHSTSTVSMLSSDSAAHCRDSLISLSIDVADHERSFQLIKEILLKNHLVFDLWAFKKLLAYLYNGVIYNATPQQPFNQYYFGLIWNLFESQAVYHEQSSKELNEFISELIGFVQLPVTDQVNRASIADYNTKVLLNSEIIAKAVSNFDLQVDNIYGLVLISKTLMEYQGEDISIKNQILQFQAKLINEFENVDNHYIEYTQDLIEYREQLIKQYCQMIGNMNQTEIEFKAEVLDACKICDIEFERTPVQSTTESMMYDLNLSYLLEINYQVGIEKALESLAKGYSLTSSTWEIILNQRFVFEYLETSKANSFELLQNLWRSRFEDKLKLDHIKTLVDYNNDKVNIAVVNFLSELKSDQVSSSLLKSLIASVGLSQNIYLKNLLSGEAFFDAAYKSNEDLDWVSKYSQFLVDQQKFTECAQLIENYQLLPKQTPSNMHEIQILTSGLASYLKSNDLAKFVNTFKSYSLDPGYLKQSPELVQVILSYYFIVGGRKNIDMIINKYATFKNLSPGIGELIDYTKLVNSLQKEPISVAKDQQGSINTINNLSIQIAATSEASEMFHLFNSNRKLAGDSASKSKLISKTLQYLTSASAQSSSCHQACRQRFHSLIKFFGMVKLRNLTVEQLCSAIKLLTVTKSVEILNILTTKMLNGSVAMDVINLYFLETSLIDSNDKAKVLNLMNHCSKYLDNPISSHSIEAYFKANSIKSEPYHHMTFEENLVM